MFLFLTILFTGLPSFSSLLCTSAAFAHSQVSLLIILQILTRQTYEVSLHVDSLQVSESSQGFWVWRSFIQFSLKLIGSSKIATISFYFCISLQNTSYRAGYSEVLKWYSLNEYVHQRSNFHLFRQPLSFYEAQTLLSRSPQ